MLDVTGPWTRAPRGPTRVRQPTASVRCRIPT